MKLLSLVGWFYFSISNHPVKLYIFTDKFLFSISENFQTLLEFPLPLADSGNGKTPFEEKFILIVKWNRYVSG